MTARVVKGAAAFGVTLSLGDDDALVYDARQEPSDAILARIREHEPAIVALLKARQAAAAIQWDALNDLDAGGYNALIHAINDALDGLQTSLNKLEGAARAILPTMKARSYTWGAAVEVLLTEPYNSRYARFRAKFISDAEWVAALHQARLLGYANGPQPPRRVMR